MTNDLKLTVYAIAADGRDYGTECAMFPTMEERDAHIWQMIEPDDYDPKELPDGEFELYRDKFGGDWGEAMDSYMPEDLTFNTEELTIDLATVPAVAAMIEKDLVCTLAIGGVEVMAVRLIALEKFRADVARLTTIADEVAEEREGMKSFEADEYPLEDHLENSREEMSDERLHNEFEALESIIEQARSLAADTAPTPAAAKSDLAAALEIMIDQMKSTGAWTDACNGEDDKLKFDVETAEAALAAFAGKGVEA